MGVEIFSKGDFEKALPVDKNTGKRLWLELGLIDGEYTYIIPVRKSKSGDEVRIVVRSSVSRSGVSAPNGQDSIRAWLVDQEGQPLGSKVSKWTTRLPGWQGRLTKVLRTLWGWAIKAGDCPKCGRPKSVFKVKKDGPNKGRIFARCAEHNGFTWLT